MTGIPAEEVAQSRGFLRDHYLKNLRSADGMMASRYDGAFVMDDPFPERRGERGPDPVLDGFTRAYAGAFVGYARDELGFRTDMTYVLLSGETSGHWNWREGAAVSRASATTSVFSSLSTRPSGWSLPGYADLVTPYMASRYVLEHLPPFTQPERAQLKLYPGGHMFYVGDEARKSFPRTCGRSSARTALFGKADFRRIEGRHPSCRVAE